MQYTTNLYSQITIIETSKFEREVPKRQIKIYGNFFRGKFSFSKVNEGWQLYGDVVCCRFITWIRVVVNIVNQILFLNITFPINNKDSFLI